MVIELLVLRGVLLVFLPCPPPPLFLLSSDSSSLSQSSGSGLSSVSLYLLLGVSPIRILIVNTATENITTDSLFIL